MLAITSNCHWSRQQLLFYII